MSIHNYSKLIASSVKCSHCKQFQPGHNPNSLHRLYPSREKDEFHGTRANGIWIGVTSGLQVLNIKEAVFDNVMSANDDNLAG